MSDFFTYRNKKGDIYYLYEKKDKHGHTRYYMTRKDPSETGPGAAYLCEVPEGYKIEENPRGRVSCVQLLPEGVLEEEALKVREFFAKYPSLKDMRLEFSEESIVLYGPLPTAGEMKELFDQAKKEAPKDMAGLTWDMFKAKIEEGPKYMPVARFIPTNNRERYYYLEVYIINQNNMEEEWKEADIGSIGRLSRDLFNELEYQNRIGDDGPAHDIILRGPFDDDNDRNNPDEWMFSGMEKIQPGSHSKCYRLRVDLLDGPVSEEFEGKSVSRTLEILGEQTLQDLHHAIFHYFERFDEHLYLYWVGMDVMTPFEGDTTYELPDPDGPRLPKIGKNKTLDLTKTTIDSMKLEKEDVFGYLFDFGDDWIHKIEVLDIFKPHLLAQFPRMYAAEGPSPPQYIDYENDSY